MKQDSIIARLKSVIFIMLFSFAGAYAQTTFKVNGIMYVTTSNNAVAVISGGDYTGKIVIPETVKYNSKQSYNVTSVYEYAFTASVGLTSVTMPNSVDSIGDFAFSNCSTLTAVSFPDSVKTIGKYAFQNSPALTSITIPNTISKISEGMFYSCSGLNEISIPASITSIADYSFTFCTGLKKIYFTGNKLNSMGNSSFAGCTGLTEIHDYSGAPAAILSTTFSNVDKINCTLYVPVGSQNQYKTATGWMDFTKIEEQGGVVGTKFNVDGIYYEVTGPNTVAVTYGERYFVGVYSGDVSIPTQVLNNALVYTVTSIGYGTFANCRSVNSIIIPISVTSIGSAAFLKCDSLTSINIPTNIISIGDRAFQDCGSLTSINIPTGVTTIGDYTFYGCNNLTSINIPTGATSIGSGAFYSCSSLTSIKIPSGVTSIGTFAFQNCSNLTSIDIPQTLTSIHYSAFKNCRSLDSIVIPSGVTAIESETFSGCNNFKNIIIPNTINSIGNYAFGYCVSLMSIVLPDKIEAIGSYAFIGCENLKEINIPSTVNYISEYSFAGCNSLTSLSIPEGVDSIGSAAFENCRGLTTIKFPTTITYIASSAFKNCISLTSLNIPKSITTIKFGTFMGCSSLTTINIPFGIISIESNAFRNCKKLNSLVFPESITSIAEYSFTGCTNLTSITFPKNLITISYLAFENCNGLTSITLPASLQKLDSSSFLNCSSIQKIYNYCANPKILNSYLNGIDSTTCTLYVRAKSLHRYRMAKGWKSFQNIQPLSYEISTPDIKVLTNNDFTIPVSSSAIFANDSVSAFQMELKYDSTRMIFKSYDADTTFTNHGSLLINSDTKGVLKMGYISDKYFDFEGNMLNLHFKSQKSGVRVTDFTKFLFNTEDALNTQKGKVEIMGYGDVDYNQDVQSYDASLALIKSVGLNPMPDVDALPWEELRMDVADVDGNKSVTAYDAGLILKKSIDLIAVFPIEESLNTPQNLNAPQKANVSNTADVTVIKEGKNLVFRSYGNLTGLNLSFNGEIGLLSSPLFSAYLKNFIQAKNINDLTYNVGIAFSSSPAEGSVIMSIPLKSELISDLSLQITVNQQQKVVSLNTNTSGVTSNTDNQNSVYLNSQSNEIHFNTPNELSLVTITDLTGRTIYKSLVDTSKNLYIGNLISGIYLVTVEQINGNLIKSKILKR